MKVVNCIMGNNVINIFKKCIHAKGQHYIMLRNETWFHNLTMFKTNLYATHHGSMIKV